MLIVGTALPFVHVCLTEKHSRVVRKSRGRRRVLGLTLTRLSEECADSLVGAGQNHIWSNGQSSCLEIPRIKGMVDELVYP